MTRKSDPEFYELIPVTSAWRRTSMIANASGGHCGLCGRMTTSMGGSNNQICVPCAKTIIAKRAVGTINWGDEQ